MDEGLDFVRRSVRETADRLDGLLRRLEHHVEDPGDIRVQQWARPFVPSLTRELEGLRAYAHELGSSAPSGLSRSVAGAIGEAAAAVLGMAEADAWDLVLGTVGAAHAVRDRVRGLRAGGQKLKNARLAEIAASLTPEVDRLLGQAEPLLELLFVEKARPEAGSR